MEKLIKTIPSLLVFHLYISVFEFLRTVMYQSSETRSGPSQASKINLLRE